MTELQTNFQGVVGSLAEAVNFISKYVGEFDFKVDYELLSLEQSRLLGGDAEGAAGQFTVPLQGAGHVELGWRKDSEGYHVRGRIEL